jgi:hypothetical protein
MFRSYDHLQVGHDPSLRSNIIVFLDVAPYRLVENYKQACAFSVLQEILA